MMNPWIEKIGHAVDTLNFIYNRYYDEIDRLWYEAENESGGNYLIKKRDETVMEFFHSHNFSLGEKLAIWRGVAEARGWKRDLTKDIMEEGSYCDG